MLIKLPRYQFSLSIVISFFTILTLFTALIAASQPPDDDEICLDGRCYPRAFIPTTEFKEILEGQQIPPGLHIRMDFNTGKKEAKLNNPAEDNTPGDLIFVDEAGKPISTDHPENSSSTDSSLDSFSTELPTAPLGLPSPPKDSPLSSSDTTASIPMSFRKMRELGDFLFSVGDDDIFSASLLILRSAPTETTIDDRLEALDSLLDFAHSIDFGVLLAEGDGLAILLSATRDGETPQIRARAATVLGAALSNNPRAQKEALKLDIHTRLLGMINIEEDVAVIQRQIYAFGALVRGNPRSTKLLIEDGRGLQVLMDVYLRTKNDDVLKRGAMVIADAMDKEMAQSEDIENLKEMDEEPEQVLFEVPGEKKLVAEQKVRWCRVLQEAVMERRLNLDAREKIIRAVITLKEWCPSSNELFESWVASEKIKEGELQEYTELLEKLNL